MLLSEVKFFLISMCVPWELNPIMFFALQTQCSTTEPQKHDLWVESKQPFCGHKAKILTHVY